MNTNANSSELVRVLLVMHGAGSGGVETALATICKYLDKKRVKVTVAVPKEGLFTERVKAFGVDVVETPIEWWTPANWEFGERHYYRFLSTLQDRIECLVKIIGEREIDVVHSSTLTVFDGALAARVAGKPHIWNMRGQFAGGPGSSFGIYLPIQVIYDIVDSLSARIVANSHTVKTFLLNYLPDEKIDVIQNGVDLSRFDERKNNSLLLETEFPNLKGMLRIALVGRIAAVKGIEDFIDAAVRVSQQRNDTAFVVVGAVEDEALYEKAKDMASKAGIKERVVFTGRREDIPALLHEIDLMVCSSLSEGLPNSCLEAMAASKPIVATRCGGTHEVVFDGENGFLAPVGNPAELAHGILKVIENGENLRSMGEKGRARIEGQFSADRCAKKYEELYFHLRDQWISSTPRRNPWDDVILHLASHLGQTGQRVQFLEREVRDLKSFESYFKDNFVYRTLKHVISKKE